MNIPPYATIVVSYISYEPQTIALNGRNNLHIRMEEKEPHPGAGSGNRHGYPEEKCPH